MNRRHLLHLAGVAAAGPLSAAIATPARRLGVTIWSYQIRWRKETSRAGGWNNALDVLDYCRELGAGCLQIGVNRWSHDFAGQVRTKRESLGIALEGQIALPQSPADLDRFDSEIRAAKEAGASVVRTVCLNGRRYENFHHLESWKTFERESRAALERSEPVAARHRVRLAVENHKDWRSAEQRALLDSLSSEWIGVTFDFGNNFSLLEHPRNALAALAPYLLTTHFKDMALAPCDQGFLLSEVPLGEGVLDLAAMIRDCEAARPGIWFNLEMITRDPLKVPALEDHYFTTLAQVPAQDLAQTLKLARSGNAAALPTVSGRDEAAQIEFEDKNVRQCFAYAREKLGFS